MVETGVGYFRVAWNYRYQLFKYMGNFLCTRITVY